MVPFADDSPIEGCVGDYKGKKGPSIKILNSIRVVSSLFFAIYTIEGV